MTSQLQRPPNVQAGWVLKRSQRGLEFEGHVKGKGKNHLQQKTGNIIFVQMCNILNI